MIGELKTIVMDAADHRGLATFYTDLLGWTLRYADDDWVTLTTEDGWRIGIQAAPGHVSPQWPDGPLPQHAHLDLLVPDLEAASTRAIDLGATMLRRNETWHTLADLAGHPFDLCVKPDNPGITLMGVVIDCSDASALSRFYAELLGKPVTTDADGVAVIGERDAHPVIFEQVDGYTPPRWPDPAYPQQLHLDVTVDDIEAAEAAVLALGAIRLPGDGENWRVYADPVGKPFCLLWPMD
jgi:catechol-2,3-dioxygenase